MAVQQTRSGCNIRVIGHGANPGVLELRPRGGWMTMQGAVVAWPLGCVDRGVGRAGISLHHRT